MKKIIIVMLLVLSTACSTHKAVRQPNLTYDLNAQQNKMNQNGLELMIKPIHLKSELTTFFDDDLLEYGILPVQVALCNKTEETIHFSTEGINLIDPSGNRCPLMPVQSVVDKTKKSYWRSAGWGVAFGVFGLIPSAINVSNTNKKIQADYDSRILKSGNMVSGAVTEGMAFFEVPENFNTLDGWKLAITYKDPLNDKMEIIEYGMTGNIKKRELPENKSTDSSAAGDDA